MMVVWWCAAACRTSIPKYMYMWASLDSNQPTTARTATYQPYKRESGEKERELEKDPFPSDRASTRGQLVCTNFAFVHPTGLAGAGCLYIRFSTNALTPSFEPRIDRITEKKNPRACASYIWPCSLRSMDMRIRGSSRRTEKKNPHSNVCSIL